MANASAQNLPPGLVKKIERTIEERSATSSPTSSSTTPAASAEPSVVTTDTLPAAKTVQSSTEFQTSRQTTQHLAEIQYQENYGQDGRILWETAGGKILYHQLADGQYLLSLRFSPMAFMSLFFLFYFGIIFLLFIKSRGIRRQVAKSTAHHEQENESEEPPLGPIHRVQRIQLD